jgi:hypothetical protein
MIDATILGDAITSLTTDFGALVPAVLGVMTSFIVLKLGIRWFKKSAR